MRIEDEMHCLILDRASPYTIRHFVQRKGMRPMADSAKRAVLEGKTTVPEIQRAVLAEEGKEQLCGSCQRVMNLEFTICPFCQHVLKEKCGGCGNPVEASWEAWPIYGKEVDREWKRRHCRRCLAPAAAVVNLAASDQDVVHLGGRDGRRSPEPPAKMPGTNWPKPCHRG